MKVTALLDTRTVSRLEGVKRGWFVWAMAKISDYLQLVKFKLSALVVFTTGLGYLIAVRNTSLDLGGHFALTLLGSFLVVGAANAFNQILERETDALMERTKNRPLPSGRMGLAEAVVSSALMVALGLAILAAVTNWRTVLLSSTALAIYALAYTPLKRKSEFCTLVGAVSGAIPPMMGWVAVRNEFGQEGLALFALQFLWQFPHLWAIAWMYREDYQRAGLHLLPLKGEPSSVARQTIYYSFATVVASAYPLLSGGMKPVYALGILALGCWLIGAALRFHRCQNRNSAKNLLVVADTYLPLVLFLWLLAKE